MELTDNERVDALLRKMLDRLSRGNLARLSELVRYLEALPKLPPIDLVAKPANGG